MRKRYTLGMGALLCLASAIAGSPAANAVPMASCNNPTWVSSTAGGGRSGDGIYNPGNSPYINDNNMWNATDNRVTQTMSVCSHKSWYVDDTVGEPATTAVKAYPNVHVDYHNWVTGSEPAISSYRKIVTSYAGYISGTGIYNVAYDVWLNGVGGAANEVMIWTQNSGQRPGGSIVASHVTLSGRSWDVWARPDNKYLAFVPSDGQSYPSGTLDLSDFFGYLVSQDRLPANSTLGQIGYGIEVVSTSGSDLRFTVTNFRVAPPHRAVE